MIINAFMINLTSIYHVLLKIEFIIFIGYLLHRGYSIVMTLTKTKNPIKKLTNRSKVDIYVSLQKERFLKSYEDFRPDNLDDVDT